MKSEHPPICDYEGSTYQTTFWEEANRAYEDRAEAIALNRLLPSNGHRLLEVGAGAGRNTPRYRGFEQIVLLDYSTTQLRQAQTRLGKGDRYMYVAADTYHLPFVDGVFDEATMIRVIHHLVDGPQALAEVRRTMVPGGEFILEFANKRNIKAVFRFLLGKQPWNPFTPEPIEFVPLNFNFHPATMRAWLEEAGFSIERQLTVSHFRLPLLKKLIPTNILVKMDACAQLTGNWWQWTPSVFVHSRTRGNSPVAGEGAFFKCPTCGGIDFDRATAYLLCGSCQTRWAIEDGIYNFKEPM